ncbi:GntR family transcriptional regulator [Jannaschia formosa]|uniref:GntR family transcriptional regulator n=1 Tax=Jannaschia formosa TaxID=2259592 RepID=UPI0010752B70|nr:GntR family transcriptional regulator [Jannaschia formosa]TFL20267.1 GntR family transcriptional regulator [Jannaschia formosa]
MTTRSQMIERRLREGILEGEFPAEQRMNEVELATRLGVSRTPVRSALAILAKDGLLKYAPNSGFTVQAFDSSDIEAIYDLRATLSGLTARLAAERGLAPDQLDRLHVVLSRSERIIDEGIWTRETLSEWQGLNETFHEAIDRASSNVHAEAALRRTKDIPLLKEIRYRWIEPDALAINHAAHVNIVDAIRRGQQVRAEDMCREHVYQNGQRIVRQWRKIEQRNAASDAANAKGSGHDASAPPSDDPEDPDALFRSA